MSSGCDRFGGVAANESPISALTHELHRQHIASGSECVGDGAPSPSSLPYGTPRRRLSLDTTSSTCSSAMGMAAGTPSPTVDTGAHAAMHIAVKVSPATPPLAALGDNGNSTSAVQYTDAFQSVTHGTGTAANAPTDFSSIGSTSCASSSSCTSIVYEHRVVASVSATRCMRVSQAPSLPDIQPSPHTDDHAQCSVSGDSSVFDTSVQWAMCADADVAAGSECSKDSGYEASNGANSHSSQPSTLGTVRFTAGRQRRAFSHNEDTLATDTDTDDHTMLYDDAVAPANFVSLHRQQCASRVVRRPLRNANAAGRTIGRTASDECGTTPKARPRQRPALADLSNANEQHSAKRKLGLSAMRPLHKAPSDVSLFARPTGVPVSRKRSKHTSPMTHGDEHALGKRHKGTAVGGQENELCAPVQCSATGTKLSRAFSETQVTRPRMVDTKHSMLDELDVVGDFSRKHSLPILPRHKADSHCQDLKNISAETVASLLQHPHGAAAAFGRNVNVHLIDCRYPYEYDGGHIMGAVNVYEESSLIGRYATGDMLQAADRPHVFIFHCEFSQMRGPRMNRMLRNVDRAANAHRYPQLAYPEVYVMDGGYRAFYSSFPELCTPMDYVRMDAQPRELAKYRSRSNSRLRSNCAADATVTAGGRRTLFHNGSHRISRRPLGVGAGAPAAVSRALSFSCANDSTANCR